MGDEVWSPAFSALQADALTDARELDALRMLDRDRSHSRIRAGTDIIVT